MIKVIVGNNTVRKTMIVEPSRTLKSVLEEAQVDYSKGAMHLDGATLEPGALNRTFADMGVTEKCFLLNVAKADNA